MREHDIMKATYHQLITKLRLTNKQTKRVISSTHAIFFCNFIPIKQHFLPKASHVIEECFCETTRLTKPPTQDRIFLPLRDVLII